MEAPAHLTPPSRLPPPASSAAPLRTASLPPVSTLGPGSPGAGLALLPKRPHPRALSAAGLVLAAVGLVALDLAGLAAPSGRMLLLRCAPVAAGLALALAALAPRGRPGRGAGRPGPAAGRPGGRLPGRRGGAAARAYRRHHGARGARRAGDGGRALDADRGGPRRSGRTGAGLHRKAPDRCQTQSGPEPGPGIAPGADRERSRAARRSPRRVTRSIMGKLTAVANRIVDRGELCVCPVKERRCQSTLSS